MPSKKISTRLYASAIGLTLFGSTVVAPLGAAYAATAPSPANSGSEFSVSEVAGGYEVTINLDAPLEMRNEIPTIYADGVDLGPARESADGTQLTVVTSDPIAASAKTIEYAFGDLTPETGASTAPSGVTTFDIENAEELDLDPSSTGKYSVTEFGYDFGTQAVDLKDIGGIKGEFRAQVYMPENKSDVSPVVVFQHGRHTSCSTGTANPNRYPCGDNQIEIPSYLGYAHTAKKLASHGYVVVSVSVNAINSNDNQLASDYGATARGQIVLDHLDFLAQANQGSVEQVEDKLVGKLDLDNIGLMGHSRGGEGVARAVQLNQGLEKPYGIKTVLPLAPVDFSRATTPGVSFLTVLPYCDGDVTSLQGQHMFDDNNELMDDNALRASLLVMGANHNFFNTVWDPAQYSYAASDDWSPTSSGTRGAICSTSAEDNIRISAEDQRQVGDSIMNGWFRLTLGGEEQFLPLFDGSNVTIDAYNGASVVATVSAPSEAKASINTLATLGKSVRVIGTGTVRTCSTQNECGAEGFGAARVPHWASMRFSGLATGAQVAQFKWTAANAELALDVPAAARNAAAHETVNFQLSPGAGVTDDQGLSLKLVDGQNNTSTVALANYTSAVQPLPGNSGVTPLPAGEHANLGKVILRQVSVPLTAFNNVDLSDIRRVSLVGTARTGHVLVKDVAFQSPSLGDQIAAPELPVVNVSDVYVNEGDSITTALVGITLDKKSTKPVTGHFEVFGGANDGKVTKSDGRFTIPAGKVCVVQEVTLNGNRTTSTAAVANFGHAITAIQGAITGKNHGVLSVREDDAVVTSAGIVLPMAENPGVQSDPCAGQNFEDSRTIADLVEESVTYGSKATVLANVLSVSGDVAPTGSVTVYNGGEAVGTATISAKGSARISVAGLAVGSHTLVAKYEGDSNYAPSESVVELKVVKAKSAPVAKLAKSSITAGTSTSLQVSVPGATGTVTAKIGSATVKATLKSGKATIALPKTLKVGTHAVTVTYSGNANLASATVKAGSVKVVKATAKVTGKLSKTTIKKGASTKLVVNVKASTGTATGKATVKVAGKTVVASIKSGKATVTLPKSLKAGTHKVVVSYSGDSKVAAKSASVAVLTIKK